MSGDEGVRYGLHISLFDFYREDHPWRSKPVSEVTIHDVVREVEVAGGRPSRPVSSMVRNFTGAVAQSLAGMFPFEALVPFPISVFGKMNYITEEERNCNRKAVTLPQKWLGVSWVFTFCEYTLVHAVALLILLFRVMFCLCCTYFII
jgi:hypothetical protein